MHASKLLESLTPARREAVEHLDGPLLVLAGPGSGKTRVITHRIANLLHHGVAARQILALTFTNKAADEMRARIDRLAPGEPVWMSTFHRFCAKLLRQYAPLVGLHENYTIYDTADSQKALARTLEALDLESAHFTPERIASAISWAKNNLIGPEQYEPRPGHPLGNVVAKCYAAYQARLLASSAVDFDDLLFHVAMLLRSSPETRATLDERYRYILVDEYQDTNLAQYAIVRALSVDHPNLAVTGDPDQSIYGWRGANLRNILDFEHDFPNVRVVKLERNYRSTQNILHVADTLINYNTQRKSKRLYTENPEGRPVRLIAHGSHLQEAENIATRIAAEVASGKRRPRDFAVFYRVNALSRALEFAMRAQGVPYQMVHGLEFFQRKEIKDVLGYLHLLNNPRDDVAFLRVVNTPPRGIGKQTLSRLAAHAAQYRLTLLEAARESGLIESLSKRAATTLANFVAIVDRLGLVAGTPVEEALGHVLAKSGYRQLLEESDDEQDQERLANIEELLSAARQFDQTYFGPSAVEAFLEQACLVNDTDDWEADNDRVTLMTLHAAKGLEFPVVFITALEEGLIPHERCRNEERLLEEERRLLFVGITRAKEELELSRAIYRDFRGQGRMTVPSQFLMELPRGEMQVIEPSRLAAGIYDLEGGDLEQDVAIAVGAEDGTGNDALQTAAARTIVIPNLATAAELHEGPATEQPELLPDEFVQGMLVRHPEYGVGKILALAGRGPRRTATVAFASSAGERKFMLAKCKLRPAKSR